MSKGLGPFDAHDNGCDSGGPYSYVQKSGQRLQGESALGIKTAISADTPLSGHKGPVWPAPLHCL
ncbi:hypothetical protein NYE70_05440 [Paenibacillus sp. FSL R5-0407]|uniref:hypothetical protein n=1 Tax=Paenibacillus sp. FSL R5-0407 TaxID=2975320 RepID=UPI0030F7FF58